MRALVDLHAWQAAGLLRHVVVLGDQQHALDGGLKRVPGSERHGGGRLADSGDPDGRWPLDGLKGPGDTQPPIDTGKPGLKEIE